MRWKKSLSIVVLLLLLSIIWVSSGLAQDATAEATQEAPEATQPITVTPLPTPITFQSASDVAILVVDVFNDPPEPSANDNLAHKNCTLSFDGMDSSQFQGNTTTPALHPYVLPHGQLVSRYMEDVLKNEQSATEITEFIKPDPANPIPVSVPSWMTFKVWDVRSEGNVWLVNIDTNDYDVDKIAQHIDDAVKLLQYTTKRFVINMSFGVVPCKSIPIVTLLDYRDLLLKWNITCDPDGIGLSAFSCIVNNLINSNSTPLQAITAISAFRNQNVANAAAFSLIQIYLTKPQARTALSAGIDVVGSDIVSKTTDLASHYGVSIIQVASAGNNSEPVPYYPAKANNVLSVSADYTHGNCPLIRDESNLSTFLSGTLHFPADVSNQIVNEMKFPATNNGEVVDNGVSDLGPEFYFKFASGAAAPPILTNAEEKAERDAFDAFGCLVGTSFSAPRVSIRMALHFFVTDITSCVGPYSTVTPSSPPLDHDAWDNLSVLEARNRYCTDFQG